MVRAAPVRECRPVSANPHDHSRISGLRLAGLSDRQCDGCTACCTHLPMPAGHIGPAAKPAGEPCQHLGAEGCAIYASRCRACAQFRCNWLADDCWPEAWRPDHSGLLCLRDDVAGYLPAGVIYEIAPHALDSPLATNMVQALLESTAAVVLVSGDGSRRVIWGRNAAPVASGRPLLRRAA